MMTRFTNSVLLIAAVMGTAMADETMVLCANCTKGEGCSTDTDSISFSLPVGKCYSPLQLYPESGDVWGDFDVLDECGALRMKRTFYASSDGTCTTETDSYELEYDTCLGPFGLPRPWGVFTCDDDDKVALQ